MHVIICGAGAIGAATAYFLTGTGADITLVERAGIAAAASGKSGGFLALDWCDGQPIEQLARRSFHLHDKLAGTLDADWGYRRMNTFAGYAVDGEATGPVEWVSGKIAITQRLGGPETTAQVHPARFTEALAQAALRRGARHLSGTVDGIATDMNGRLRAVVVDGTMHRCDAAVIALGPWSALAAEWLPLPAVHGIKGHSLIFRTGAQVPAEALFLEYHDEHGAFTPEIFPRSDGTTYVCGLSSHSPLPVNPATVAPDPDAFARLEAACARISPVLAQSPIEARQVCYRPVSIDGWPLIGAVSDVPGAFTATAHSVWGILNAPATGEALAELITDGETRHVDISPFTPDRLPRHRHLPHGPIG